MQVIVELDAKPTGSPRALTLGQSGTPVGPAVAAWDHLGLRWLSFGSMGEHKTLHELATVWPGVTIDRDDAQAARVLDQAFSGSLEMPLVLQGTHFQRHVWRALLGVAFGHTVSYGELAKRLGNPGASRAVGSAVGANALAFVVPCHRVVRSDGSTGKFRWGEKVKVSLLDWESGFSHSHVL